MEFNNEKEFQELLEQHKENWSLIVDSACYDLYNEFFDFVFSDGGDDDFADFNPRFIAFELCKLLTEEDIEFWDTDLNNEHTLSIYQKKKNQLLNKWGWK